MHCRLIRECTGQPGYAAAVFGGFTRSRARISGSKLVIPRRDEDADADAASANDDDDEALHICRPPPRICIPVHVGTKHEIIGGIPGALPCCDSESSSDMTLYPPNTEPTPPQKKNFQSNK